LDPLRHALRARITKFASTFVSDIPEHLTARAVRTHLRLRDGTTPPHRPVLTRILLRGHHAMPWFIPETPRLRPSARQRAPDKRWPIPLGTQGLPFGPSTPAPGTQPYRTQRAGLRQRSLLATPVLRTRCCVSTLAFCIHLAWWWTGLRPSHTTACTSFSLVVGGWMACRSVHSASICLG